MAAEAAGSGVPQSPSTAGSAPPHAGASSALDDDELVGQARQLPEAVTAPALQHAEPSGAIPDQPLERAGPSQAFKTLNLQRSAPSGSFSKQFQLRVQAFAHH